MTNPENMREDLKEILSQKEYQMYGSDEKNIIQTWWETIKEWFRDLLSDLLFGLEPSNGLADTMLIILFGVVLLLVVFGLFLIVRSSRRNRVFRSRQPFQSTNELEWSVERHLQEATKQAKSSRYSYATRHEFLALLLYFHEQKWLSAETWKTNWDYYSELEQQDKLRAEAFYDLARTFDEAFYGKREIGADEYDSYRKKIRSWLGAQKKMHVKDA